MSGANYTVSVRTIKPRTSYRPPIDSSVLFLHPLCMTKWEELGRVVQAARLRAGYTDTKVWAEAVKRSTRVTLGLERGEHVGAQTLTRVEVLLGWPDGWSKRILDGEVTGPPPDQKAAEQLDLPSYAEMVQELRELRREVREWRRDGDATSN